MKYLILILSTLFIFACATVKDEVVEVNMPETVYSEGYLNIVDIMNTWKPGPQTSSIGGMPMFGFINPNLDEDIRYVLVVIYIGMPVGYSYLLHGEPYVYFINEAGEFKKFPEINEKQWKLNFQDMFLLEAV